MARKPRSTPPKTKISQLRQEAGFSQAELADRAGIPLRTVQRLEQGRMDNPPIRYLTNIAFALGCQLRDVIDDEWRQWTVFDQSKPKPPKRPRGQV